jgi:FAD/FMN-containing dehydrogenase
MIDDNLEKIVGKDNILDNPEILEEYSRDCSFTPPKMPALVVKPASLEELQGIIRWANEKRIPLVPVSSAPHFRVIRFPELRDQSLWTCAV